MDTTFAAITKFLLGLFILAGLQLNAQQLDLRFSLKEVVNDYTVDFSKLINAEYVVIISYSNQCAYADRYTDRIKQLAADFGGSQKFRFFLVNPNVEKSPRFESEALMRETHKRKQLNLPYLADKEQKLSNQLGIDKIPEVCILKYANGSIVMIYRGAIDDNAQSEVHIQKHYVRDILTAIQSGTTLNTLEETHVMGCPVRKF
jgi:hypothetical protein